MAIMKQEFYEGAALHILIRSGAIASLRYESPFFQLNNRVWAYLKYSTKGRSPWGFTFMPEEQAFLRIRASNAEVVIGLICGADGVAGFNFDAYRSVAAPRKAPLHIACYRTHGKYYEVKGPDGTLGWKVAPSNWKRILER